ncbi:MAG: Rab family GTPase [Mariprofundaceae bacterium]|nr:Rab family GTPase [Mariprofundaceae bacterium]
MIQKKICILGAAGVGKTSLTAQFVYSKFSEKYLSTMGVKIDKKVVKIDNTSVNLMIWDIHGEEKYKKITSSYVRGSAGIFTVIDGTRSETIQTAHGILERVHSDIGKIPNIFLLNKSDLSDAWDINEQALAALKKYGDPMYTTSAKTGEHVDLSFQQLTKMLINP